MPSLVDDPIRENKNSELGRFSPKNIEFNSSVDDRGRIVLPNFIRSFICQDSTILCYMPVNSWCSSSRIKIVSKNRISIPSFIRRSLSIYPSEKLQFIFNEGRIFILKDGCGSVADSIRVCGLKKQKTLGLGSNPGRGPGVKT